MIPGSSPVATAQVNGFIPILPPTSEGQRLIVLVSSVEVDYLEQSVEIEHQLSGRSTCNFSIVDLAGLASYQCGEKIEVYFECNLIFAGTIDAVTERFEEGTDAKFIEIECVDWHQLCDRCFVANSYEEKTLRQIVARIVNYDTWLHDEGITLGSIDNVTELNIVRFNYKSATDCFDRLAEATGYDWKITPNKVLNFYDRATYVAPFAIGDSYQNYMRLEFGRDRSEYRNRQWMLGGDDMIDPDPEYFRGDYATIEPTKRRRTFNLKFAVGEISGENPDGDELGIWRISDVEVATKQRVGLRGVDKDGDLEEPSSTTWKQWFYKPGEKEISQNSATDPDENPVLTHDEQLKVVYRGQIPIILDHQDDAEIAARAAIEGGTGIYEAVDEDDTINGRDMAEERASRLLAKFGRIPRQIDFEIDRIGLEPGQLMTVTIAGHGITAIEFMVDTVKLRFLRSDYVRCGATILDGQRQNGWSDYWAKLAKQGRKTEISDDDVIIKTKRLYESINVGDSLSAYTAVETLHAYQDDPYTVALFGEVAVPGSSEVVTCFCIGRSVFGEPAYVT